jgi:hypothetical protein
MESIIFAGAVFGMLWLCLIVYKSDKNKTGDDNLGIFAFKVKKDVPHKAGLKK